MEIQRTPNRRLLGTLVAISVGVVACGGGSDDADSAPATDAAPATEVPSDSAPASSDVQAPSTEAPVSVPQAEWDGPNAIELLDAFMDELAVPIGSPVSPETLSPIFEIPTDLVYADASVIGVMQEWDLDQRTDDEPIEEFRSVGLDVALGIEGLDALVEANAAGGAAWTKVSRSLTGYIQDLYTQEPDGRFSVGGPDEPREGEPPSRYEFDYAATEIPLPAWAAGLPTVPGGKLTAVTQGLGDIGFFQVAGNGYVLLRNFYPADRLAELEAFVNSNVVRAAGFEYEDSPISNAKARLDVSQGDWTGTVFVGSVNINGELAGYNLDWTLLRNP